MGVPQGRLTGHAHFSYIDPNEGLWQMTVERRESGDPLMKGGRSRKWSPGEEQVVYNNPEYMLRQEVAEWQKRLKTT